MTGKGAYADKSIFFPATGYAEGSALRRSFGSCWSSTADPDDLDFAWDGFFSADGFARHDGIRYFGRSVRPVRDAD